jgi:[acyl-carrier-protein] S-malonyltransferase
MNRVPYKESNKFGSSYGTIITMKRAFLFPGQGSQAPGMGKDLAEAFASAREVFEEVDDALGEKLSAMMFEGTKEDLTLTHNAQPALMAVSVAVLRTIEAEGKVALPDLAGFVAGHSLGEYSALTAAGAFPLATAAKLLRTRGLSMQEAVPVGEGAMAAILGAELDAVEAVAKDAEAGDAEQSREPGVCTAANDNAPGQIVISGSTASVEYALELAKERGIRKAMRLPVSAPFHCSLMAPAADRMAEALDDIDVMPPRVPVVANVTAQAVSDPETIKKLLVEQVTARVRWRECVLAMRDAGVDTMVEMGTGKVLTGMTKRIDGDITGSAIQAPADIEAFLNSL